MSDNNYVQLFSFYFTLNHKDCSTCDRLFLSDDPYMIRIDVIHDIKKRDVNTTFRGGLSILSRH
jgi:hypothetical protein